DAVEAGQDLFDLGGVDIEPAADVHVLEPVGDGQVAAFVDLADVAGVQPAVGVDGGGGGLRVVEVAQHHVGAAQQHLTGAVLGRIVDAQLEAGDRAAAGGGHRDRVVLGPAHGAETAGLGEAVGGQHDVDVQLGLHPLDQHD